MTDRHKAPQRGNLRVGIGRWVAMLGTAALATAPVMTAAQTYPSTPAYPGASPAQGPGTMPPYVRQNYPDQGGNAPVNSGQSYPGQTDPNGGPAYGYGPNYVPPPGGDLSRVHDQGVPGGTYRPDELIGAAQDVFGQGAHGLADVIRNILKKQGQPDGYIVGKEGGGAFVVGLRYGSGTLNQKLRPARRVYWTGPSLGPDVGGSAAKTFVLVYNLYNPEDIYHSYGAGEGQAYLIGGFHVSYLRHQNVVLIPVRVGVGLRLGINGGYMKVTRTQKWMPF